MPRTRWLALTVLCAATLMIILDGTIVTVALPSIPRDLGFSPAALSWVRRCRAGCRFEPAESSAGAPGEVSIQGFPRAVFRLRRDRR